MYEETGLNERLLDEWEFPVEIPAEEMDLMLIRRLCEIDPYISLPQSAPAIYDNKFTLQRSLLRNRQCNFCDKVESRGIVLQLLARFFEASRTSSTLQGQPYQDSHRIYPKTYL
ncbi:hypothetical protein [uncultured Bacteroides sp.]|uniref:hypothetical protein n=1 Tax=uncultured Bacteroides sp. TaxID=162156 RepID=UPI0025E83389|nr:hypothetical protein [uncultured Bacteroides sp.]